jgi:hypothetical protein
MENKMKFEVEIDLADFFSSETERSRVFCDALERAIINRLCNDNAIAWHLFEMMKGEAIKPHLETIRGKIAASADEYNCTKWEIATHKSVGKLIDEVLEEKKESIKERARETAQHFMDDAGDHYDSLRNRVADACVNNVYEVFLKNTIEREINK